MANQKVDHVLIRTHISAYYKKENKLPSVRQLRELLGNKGSMNVLAAALREYRREIVVVQPPDKAVDTRSFTPQIAELEKLFSTKIKIILMEKLEAIRYEVEHDANERIGFAEKQADEFARQNETLSERLAQLREDFNITQKELLITRESVGAAKLRNRQYIEKNDALEAEIKALKEECKELKKKMAQEKIKKSA